MHTEYNTRILTSEVERSDVSKDHLGISFRYSAMPNQSGLYKFWFHCGAGTEEEHYLLLSTERTYREDCGEPVILISPRALALLSDLADAFSKWSNLSYDEFASEFFVSENCIQIESVMQKYFYTILYLFNKAYASLNVSTSRFWGYSRLLEELLFLNTIRVRAKNHYLIPPTHPMVMIQNYVEMLTKNEIRLYLDLKYDERPAETRKLLIEREVLLGVLDAKNNNQQLKLMQPNQIYEVSAKPSYSGLYTAVAFHNKPYNTEIPAIRLFEKIKDYQHTHKEIAKQLDEIRIACFGTLTDFESLQTLCRKMGISQEISLTCFEPERDSGEYFFQSSYTSSPKKGNEVYDLFHSADLETLFRLYHIVLFLDLNCFYKQYQSKKTIDERSSPTNCKWYWERSEQLQKFKSKASYYQLIYKHISMWLNSYKKEYSGRFEFNADLFHTINMAHKSNADVYLYLGYGDQISDLKLRDYNICNDEYYDGKELIVYKFISKNTSDLNEYYSLFLKEQEHLKQLKIIIDLWKIIKSINNAFYKEVIRQLSEINAAFDIAELMDVSCILHCTDISNGTVLEISYYLQSREPKEAACQDVLEQIMEVVMNQAFGTGSPACIRNYFKNLIIHYMISNSTSLEELMFAHMLSTNRFLSISLHREEWHTCTAAPSDSIIKLEAFKARNTLYSIINRLDSLRLRTIEDRTGYFVNGFRRSYCPDMNEDVFRNMMTHINQYCQEWGYIDSRLYVNSKIE